MLLVLNLFWSAIAIGKYWTSPAGCNVKLVFNLTSSNFNHKIFKLVRNGRHDGLFEVLGLDDVGLRPGCLVPRLGGDVAADATLFCRLQGHHY